jgi:pimeloyl-ACP methyl ester carboxylesterase
MAASTAADDVPLYHQHYPARGDAASVPVGRPLVILHGLLGASGNWHTLSRGPFSEGRDVYALDQRNHGRSSHRAAFGYAEMVADLAHFLNKHDLAPAALLGHSMGGKTAMHAALAFPERVERLVVADMAPKAYPPHHEAIFEALRGIDLASHESRREIDAALSEKIKARPVRQFLLKNLDYDAGAGRYRWQMNLDAIHAAYDEIAAGLSDDLDGKTYDGPALFVRGEHSDYVADADRDAIRERFPQARLETVEGAGHWLHADRPEAFAEVVTAFLKE